MIDAEHIGQAGAHDVRHLRCGPERQLLGMPIELRDAALAFERRHALTRGTDLARDLDRRGLERSKALRIEAFFESQDSPGKRSCSSGRVPVTHPA